MYVKCAVLSRCRISIARDPHVSFQEEAYIAFKLDYFGTLPCHYLIDEAIAILQVRTCQPYNILKVIMKMAKRTRRKKIYMKFLRTRFD